MTSKQRVLKAINHEPTDKIPVDLGGSVQSTIHAYAYADLKKALGIESGHLEISGTFIFAAKVEDAVRDALQIDTVPYLLPSRWSRCQKRSTSLGLGHAERPEGQGVQGFQSCATG